MTPTTRLVLRKVANLSRVQDTLLRKISRKNRQRTIKDFKVATQNGTGISRKVDGLVMELDNRNVDVKVISERNKTKISKRLENYTMI